MYDHLQGKVIQKSTSHVILQVGGIGFKISIPRPTFEQLPECGEETLVYTYLYVREDQLKLYGFSKEWEREVFEQLLTVNGVGPSLALSILSNARFPEFQQAILQENHSYLQRIKGVGKKTAQKIVLELKSKMAKIQMDQTSLAKIPASKSAEEVFLALKSLGYQEKESRQALWEAIKFTQNKENTEELLRNALKEIQKIE